MILWSAGSLEKNNIDLREEREEEEYLYKFRLNKNILDEFKEFANKTDFFLLNLLTRN